MRHIGLRYEGPIYRPPSEAHSLLVQATIGCPHNLCTFCTVYKGGRSVRFRIRPVEEIKEDLRRAHEHLGDSVETLFFPSGNTITSDHYTNYIDVHGKLPDDRQPMLETIEKAMKRKESSFREVYLGTQ